MIDLHCHLLWDWDDGPRDRAQTLEMCHIAEGDGIDTMVVTAHLFRQNRHGGNLKMLVDRMVEFRQEVAAVPIDFHMAAEVAFHSGLLEAVQKHRFTIDATDYIFLEFPEEAVPPGAGTLLTSLMRGGLVPIICHPERNEGFRRHPELLFEYAVMGCPAMLTAMSLTGGFGPEARRAGELFLEKNLVHVIATDGHKPSGRPPVLSRGVAAAAKIVGREKAEAMVTDIPRAILKNEALPDWGEPLHPRRKKKTWMAKLPFASARR